MRIVDAVTIEDAKQAARTAVGRRSFDRHRRPRAAAAAQPVAATPMNELSSLPSCKPTRKTAMAADC